MLREKLRRSIAWFGRKATRSVPPIDPVDVLAKLLQDHGVQTTRTDKNYLICDGLNYAINAKVAREWQIDAGNSIQLDVALILGRDVILVESCAGLGESRSEAVRDAFSMFTQNAFHVLLSAFLGKPSDQVDVEQWLIAGKARAVTIGPTTIRLFRPETAGPEGVWFAPLEAIIKAAALSPGTHWLRFYYGRPRSGAPSCEVLLDNDTWAEAEHQMAMLPWRDTDGFYSVRIFIVIQDAAA